MTISWATKYLIGVRVGSIVRASLGLILIAILAGCAAPTTTVTPAHTTPIPVLAPAIYDLACPPGVSSKVGDVCAGEIASTTESAAEPFLAISPIDSNVMAIGVNGGHTKDAIATGARTGIHDLGYDVYVTKDGGKTWTLTSVPPLPQAHAIPFDDGGAGDPALAFDANGTLHLSGIVSYGTLDGHGFDVFYISTPDLGRTWSKPTLFTTDGQQDRNWISVLGDTILIPWQTAGASIQVALSTDRGATWLAPNDHETLVAKDCEVASPIVVWHGAPHVACSHFTKDGGIDKIHLYRIDITNATLAPAGTLDQKGDWPQMGVLADGTLALAYGDTATTGLPRFVATTRDGANWSKPLDVLTLTKTTARWQQASFAGVASDPTGGFHFILKGSEVPQLFRPPVYHYTYVQLDPIAGKVLAEHALPTESDSGGMRAPPSLGEQFGDDYEGLAFAGDHGVVAWMHDKAIDYAWLTQGKAP